MHFIRGLEVFLITVILLLILRILHWLSRQVEMPTFGLHPLVMWEEFAWEIADRLTVNRTTFDVCETVAFFIWTSPVPVLAAVVATVYGGR